MSALCNRIAAMLMAVVALAGASAASATERFALVIGNSSYESTTPLPNPVNDARAVAELLNSAGFEVDLALDMGQADMRRAVRDFADKLAGRDDRPVVLLYFAGHGVQIDGENYLVPVDAQIARESDVALEGLRLADVMSMLDTVPSRSRIVVLDACRNNPFERLKDTTGLGLAIVNAPAGSIVAYSTSPGATAEDGSGANSPFTTALIEAARQPGAPVETVFQQVRLAVHKTTAGRQTPWEVTALTESFAFFPGAPGAKAKPAPEKSEEQWRRELRSVSPRDAYDIVIVQNNVTVYNIFLTLHSNSQFGIRIRSLMDRQLEMMAWFEAVTLNTAEAFEAFLARYPKSDLAPTANKLTQRALEREAAIAAMPGGLDLKPTEPEIRTVVKEVKVPFEVVREVVREVKVPVIKEVIKEVKVPVEVIKEVRVPVVKEVIKEVRVPVVKEVIREVKVPVVREVVKTVTVKEPCKCGGGAGQTPLIRPQIIR